MLLHKLVIDRYRGIEHLQWHPRSGLNCLIGPGDAGKTTVLAAIGLLLDGRPPGAASEFDFHRRRTQEGFEITGVLAGVRDAAASLRVPVLQGWKDGQLLGLPDEGDAEAVLVMRVSGNADLEIVHELIPPSGDPIRCPPSFRQALPVSRIGGAGGGLAEFRLGRGGLLERHLGAIDVRAQIARVLADASASLTFPGDVEESLKALGARFAGAGLPSEVLLGIQAPPGSTLAQAIALMAGQPGQPAGEAVPFAFAGRGTRQLAMYVLTVALAKASPIVTLDEPEAGLEPYRQRTLIRNLRELVSGRGQAFLTTHSPAVVRVMQAGELWFLRGGTNPAPLDGEGIESLIRTAPDSLLSRLPVICEGPTEVGFLEAALNALLQESTKPTLDALGVRLVDGRGQPTLFSPARSLTDAAIPFGLFVDNEQRHVGQREWAAAEELCAFGTWRGVRNIEEAVASWLPFKSLGQLVQLGATLNDKSMDDCLQAIGERIGRPGRTGLEELRTAFGEKPVRAAIALAADQCSWFKTVEKGRTLAGALIQWGVPSEIRAVMEGFLESVLTKLR